MGLAILDVGEALRRGRMARRLAEAPRLGERDHAADLDRVSLIDPGKVVGEACMRDEVDLAVLML